MFYILDIDLQMIRPRVLLCKYMNVLYINFNYDFNTNKWPLISKQFMKTVYFMSGDIINFYSLLRA